MKMTGRIFNLKKGAELLMVIAIAAFGKTASSQCSNQFTFNTFPQGCGELISFVANPVPVADSIVFDFGNGETFTTNGISAQTFYNGGLYEVEVTAYHNNGCESTSSQWLTVGGLQVSLNEDTVVCQSDFVFDPIVFGGSGNYIYDWWPTTGLDDPSLLNPTLSLNVEEQYYYFTVIDQVNGCQVTDTIVVTRNDFLVETYSLCDGPVTIDLGPGATSYTWLSFTDTAGNNTNLQYPSTVQTILVDEPGEYFMYADFPNCGALTSLVTVEACESTCNNTFTYNIITGPCIIEEFAFFGAASAQVVEWHWDFGDGSTSTAEYPLHVFDQGFFEVTLTTIDIDGCEASSMQLFTTSGGFGVVAIQDSVFCQSTGHLGATVYGGSTQYTYQWSPTTGLSDPTALIPQVSGVHEQVYTLTVTDQQTGCTTVDSTVISSYTFIEETVQLCGDSVYLDMGPGADFYNWLPLYDDDYETQAIWTDDTGTFYVYAAYPQCGAITHIYHIEECVTGCTSSFVSSIDAPVCASWVEFVANTSSPVDSIHFNFGDGTNETITDTDVDHFFLTGIYEIEMIAYHSDGCVSDYSELLTIGGGMSVEIFPGGPIACAGDINLSASVSNGSGNYFYQWFANGALDNPTSATPILSEITIPTEVTLYLTDGTTGCQVADTVTFYPNFPTIETIELCTSQWLEVPAYSQTYSWTYEDEFGNTTALPGNQNVLVAANVGTYTCLSYTSGCNPVTHTFYALPCTSSCTSFFTYNYLPNGCGAQLDIVPGYTPDIDSLVYYLGDGTIVTITDGSSVQHYYPNGGYVVNMVAYHVDGCISEMTETVVIDEGLEIDILNDLVACGGDVLLMAQVSGGTSGYMYEWFVDGLPFTGSTMQSPVIDAITSATEITLFVTDSNNNCTSSDTAMIYPNVAVNETIELCSGQVVLQVPPYSQFYSWTYTDLLGNTTSLTGDDNFVVVDDLGTYTCMSYTSGCMQVFHEFEVVDCNSGCWSIFTINSVPNGCGEMISLAPTYTPDVDSLIFFFGDGTSEVSAGNVVDHYYPGGVYTVQMVAYHMDGCISQMAQTVTVGSGIAVEIINDSVACGGDIFLAAYATGGSGAYMYEWFADGLPFAGSTTQSPLLPAIGQAVEISVFVSDSTGTCSASDTTVIFPNLPVNETYELCEGTVWLQVPPYSQTYSWSFEDPQGNTTSLPGNQNFYGAQNIGTYTCYSYSQACEVVFHTFEVVDCTTGCFAQISSDLDYDGCGAWLDFALNATPVIDSVIWDLGNGQTIMDEGQGPVVYYGSGSYIASAEVFFTNGCVYTTSYGITLLTEVIAEIWEDTIACNGQMGMGVDVTGGGGQYEFDWSPASMMNDPTSQYPFMTVLGTTMVTVTVVDTYTGCTVMDSVMVYANEPVNEILELCQDSVTLVLDPGSLIYQWTYTDEGGNTTQLLNFDGQNEVTVAGLGTYACFTYSSGCNTITHLFTVVDCAGNGEVWPGDANSDNIVTSSDALWVGLAFAQNGPIRPAATNDWVGQPADDWIFNFSYNNVNLKHADCDGNGIINFDDTLAIDLNYGLTHNKTEMELTGGEPELWVEAVPDTAGLEEVVNVSIYMAKSDLLVDSIHGLSFSIVWDETLTMSNNAQVNFDQSIFGTQGDDLLTFTKPFLSEGRVDIAITRMDGINLEGHGLLCQFRIVTIDNLSGMEYLPIGLENVTALTASEDTIGFILTDDVVVIDPTRTDIMENMMDHIQIFPNPTRGKVVVVNEGNQAQLQVLDSRGRIVREAMVAQNERHELDLSGMESGMYHLRMSSQEGVHFSKLKLIK